MGREEAATGKVIASFGSPSRSLSRSKQGAIPTPPPSIPDDDCVYALKAGGMTPLHYAVRYASAPQIRLLLSEGAAQFADADPEINPNIGATESPALVELLRVPSQVERERFPAGLVTPAQDARKNKLQALFHKPDIGACISAGVNLHQRVWSLASSSGSNRIQRVYILHRPTEFTPGTHRVVERLTLDDVAIAVVEGAPGTRPRRINGHPCSL